MAKIEELKSQYPRIYEYKDSVIWDLCRNPRLGYELSKPGYFVHETGPLDSDSPKFWVLYRFDEASQEVHMVSIAPVPDQVNNK